MSFAAVIALIAGYEVFAERGRVALGERRFALRLAAYLGGVAVTSLIAGLATAPFALYHFNRIAWYGLLANMAAVPLTAFWIMPWALAAFALMPFGLEGLALTPMGWGIDLLLSVARAVAALPGAVSLLPAMPTSGLILVALGGLWLCLWRRPWRFGGLLPVALGLASILWLRPPDVLATGDARLLGLRGAQGELLLSSLRANRFEAEIWQRRLGLDAPQAWIEAAAQVEGLSCDPLGCVYRGHGQSVALARDGRALIDDCARATVVVSTEPVRRAEDCAGPRAVIDRFDLWRAGSHAVWLSPDGVRVESVADRRGRRPWVRRRGDDRGILQ
jgi:competence protein ComEC